LGGGIENVERRSLDVELKDLLISGGGGLLLLMTFVEIAPIKVNPWSTIVKWIGRGINAEVLAEVKSTRARLDKHIQADDERNADDRRTRILRFNNELIRDIPHTREDFIDVLADIDVYEEYCRKHPDYKNNRAVHAIANIGRVYDERLAKHDFI
jgi:hypothetical protein